MPELELTRHAVAPAPSAPLPELEATRIAIAPVPAGARLQELEPTRAPVGNVPVAAIADLDSGRFADASERTPHPTGPVTCRYCRNVQAAGMLCDRCGMRLPRYSPPTIHAAEGAAEEGPMVPHACGAITRAGMACGSCGVFVPLPAE